MREWPYAKEPFDAKLFVLLFIKRMWIVCSALVLGALVVGGGYYLKKVVFGGPVEYDITTTYYVEYLNMDPVTGEMHNYTNGATWGTWVVSDWFVDRVWQYALDAGFEPDKYYVEKKDLKGYFTADLPSDVRIPTSTVTTPYEEVTEALNDALQLTYQEFGRERTEMESIVITNETPLAIADKDIRTLRAVILGMVLGAFVSGLGVALAIIWDDSLRLPETFTYRYAVPMTGYIGRKDKGLNRHTEVNIQSLFASEGNNVLLEVGRKEAGKQVLEMLPKELFTEAITMEAMDVKGYEKLRKADGILLLVEASAHNGKEIEYVLHELQIQECTVKGALLWNADHGLICTYRFGKHQKG